MDLRVVEQSESELVIEIGGEDHTFMNVLKGALLELDSVAAATYDQNPEQSGGQTEPLLSLKVEDGENPLDALEVGAARVNEQLNEFRTAYESAAQ
ncbi:DNA-directed RNA polymerase subunit L [Salarchaeum japonicum]|uniref:DNA-directed RNA polymerase subunit L n=1 Tax=Salarchaeum japonicum TaxID=555573 RepID=UPI003C71CFCF